MLKPELNTFPAAVRHIHLMGICGTGMAALAGMLKDSGYNISGSDDKVYPPMSTFLATAGINIMPGYAAKNLSPRPDLTVVGNTIKQSNPEALALAELSVPYVSFPQALSRFFISGRTSLLVAGTHGKTTTSALLASLLHGSGKTPGFMIGGIVQDFGRNYNISKGEYFVVEGDEYDTAFFDKGPKFLHYQPQIAIITSIEFDHADIYEDLEAVKKSFRKLVAIMPANGCLVACLDDPVVREVVSEAKCKVISYGLNPDHDWSLAGLTISPTGTGFSAINGQREFHRFHSSMPGRHNALNALAVIAVLHLLGIDRETIALGLTKFRGVKRRQEIRGEVDGITVIDDFAHHPTAVRETLAALKESFKGRRLVAVFEPRTNSSRRRVFQQSYVSAFDQADLVLIREPVPLANLPANEHFSSRQLVDDLKKRGLDAHCFSDTDGILAYLEKNAVAGDVIAILSNGGFDNIHERLLAGLEKHSYK